MQANQANTPYANGETTTPMTQDLNVLGENIARLENHLDCLRKQLVPVIRPLPESAAVTGRGSPPQLVKAERSSVGLSMEGYASRVEELINRVQFLQTALEV